MLKIQRVNIDYQNPEAGFCSTLIYGELNNHQILMLHGITHNALFFDFLAQNLAQNGYCVIAVDLPGRGQSSYFKNEKNYTYKNYSDILREILPKIGVKNPIIFGSSMGGLLSLMFLRENYFEYKKLFLNDIGFFIPSEVINKVGYYFKPLENPMKYDEMRYKISKEFSQSNLNDDELDYLFKIYTKREGDLYSFNYDAKICSAFWRGDKQKNLPDMNYKELWLAVNEIYQKPTYIIRGGISKFFPKDCFDEMITHINVKASVCFDNIGHLPLFFKDEEVKNIIKLIKE